MQKLKSLKRPFALFLALILMMSMSVMSGAVNVGVSLDATADFDDEIYEVGEIITSTVTVENTGVMTATDVEVEIILPQNLVTAEAKQVVTVEAGTTKEVTFTIRAIEAGRGFVSHKVNGTLLGSTPVSVAGEGWYGGDLHSHSNKSDGVDTVEAGVLAAYAKGMSFHFHTDHNTTNGRPLSTEFNDTHRSDMLAVSDIEVDDLYGHGLSYDITVDEPGNVNVFKQNEPYDSMFTITLDDQHPALGKEFPLIPDLENGTQPETITLDTTLKVIYTDTNTDYSGRYFADEFPDEYGLVWVPGHGRIPDEFYPTAPNDFENYYKNHPRNTDPNHPDGPIDPNDPDDPDSIMGKIVLVARGTNEFFEKLANAKRYGAIAIVVYNVRNTSRFDMPLFADGYAVSICTNNGRMLTMLASDPAVYDYDLNTNFNQYEKSGTGGYIGQISFNTEDFDSEEFPTTEIAGKAKAFQAIIDDTNADEGAFFVPAHPGDRLYPFRYVLSATGMTGVECWNGNDGLATHNILARRYWDLLNIRGDHKYVGTAITDSHNSAGMAHAYTMLKMDSLTIPNIYESIRTGAGFGSNGPQLRFDMGGVTFGETLTIGGSSQNVPLTIRVFDDKYALEKVRLYKLDVTGEDLEQYTGANLDPLNEAGMVSRYQSVNLSKIPDKRQLVQSWDLTGENLYSWSVNTEILVNDGEFYRVEVESARAATTTAKGFAFSNPIWIESSDGSTTNQAYISNITLDNSYASLLQTRGGNYYVTGNLNTLAANQLKVSTSQGATSSVTYDEVNKVFDVVVTSADGTNTNEITIFALAAGSVVEATSVKIDGAAIQQVRMRNTKQFTATINPADATDKSLTWESSNPKIFTVDKNGLVTGLSTGSAKLIITSSNGKTSFIMVQITA